MKHIFKKLLPLVLLCLVVLLANAPQYANATVPASVHAYLNTKQNNDWVVMAHASLGSETIDTNFLKTLDGQNANDYATYILAITALGRDPRSFGGIDLVAGLKSKASNNQIGDASLISDDIFGILALRSAGVSSSDPIIANAITLLNTEQQTNGSWHFAKGATDESVDFTAMGIMALLSTGMSANDVRIAKAVQFLSSRQNSDGGFGYAQNQPSNTASTAWVLSAINALGGNTGIWTKNGNTPADFINAQLQNTGYYATDATNTQEAGATTTLTAYAAIALSGKYYPITTLSGAPLVHVRVEGSSTMYCATDIDARTALEALTNAQAICGFTAVIEANPLGAYVRSIGQDVAQGLIGWSYNINTTRPQLAAQNTTLAPGDTVLWYFGEWDAKQTKIVDIPETVQQGDASIIRVLQFNEQSNTWESAQNAILHIGTKTETVPAGGLITVTWRDTGEHTVFATGAKLIPSPRVLVIVGNGAQQSLPLDATIVTPSTAQTPPPVTTNTQTKQPSTPTNLINQPLTFGISGDLQFGTIAPGESKTKQATITNTSAYAIETSISVIGSDVFKNNLTIEAKKPSLWKAIIGAREPKQIPITLSIPSTHKTPGHIQGTLIFWAKQAN